MSLPGPSLALLRARLRTAEGHCARSELFSSTGSASVDARIGDLPCAAVHEVFAATAEDATAAAGFALMLALRSSPAKPVMWVRESRGERLGGGVHAPGLVELGVDPARVFLVSAPDTIGVLRAGVDILGCGAIGAVVLEPWGKAAALDFTASRRLALAAARSEVMALVLRAGADPAPSAASTRWRVAGAPSLALTGNAPGVPTFDVSLLRHRGGVAGFEARMEWDRDRQSFFDAPLSGRVPAVAGGRTDVDLGRRAA